MLLSHLPPVLQAVRDRIPLPAREAVNRAVNTRRDLAREARRQSTATSAELVASAMPLARAFTTPSAILDQALSLAPAEGIVAEFGVYRGESLRQIAARRPGAHGFDSFVGLPEAWDAEHPPGTFAVPQLPEVGGAQLHVGWFEDTVPRFLETHAGPAALLHLDADLYSSTATVLTCFADRIVPGTVLLFDEYLNYPGWQQHEHRAFMEFVQRTGLGFEYVAYNRRAEQVTVRIC